MPPPHELSLQSLRTHTSHKAPLTLAESHLKQLCSECHLHAPKKFGPLAKENRGGGCLACHINHSSPNQKGMHPTFSLNITQNKCFGCHNRSSRISTSYMGYNESLDHSAPPEADKGFASKTVSCERVFYPSKNSPPQELHLEDDRLFKFVQPDIHFTKGMECIDCHSDRDLMGDGKIHLHQEEATEISCQDCHFENASLEKFATWNELDTHSQKILQIRGVKNRTQLEYKLTKKRSTPLINIIKWPPSSPNQEIFFFNKLSGQMTRLKPSKCLDLRRVDHQRLSCASCHSAWAPQCLSCHTQKAGDGKWKEFMGAYRADPPSLGVDQKKNEVVPVVPGMIITLNTKPYDLSSTSFNNSQKPSPPSHPLSIESFIEKSPLHRLFTSIKPHTTSAQSRSCQSCHGDPLALGYGRGTLTSTPRGWKFLPEYEALSDGLPADAWIRFPFSNPSLAGISPQTSPSASPSPVAIPPELSARKSLKESLRPFNLKEQERILVVGKCLLCHKANDSIFLNFKSSLLQMKSPCKETLPE